MYPLSSCRTCIHREVCKLIELYQDVQNQLPINLELAECEKYTVDEKAVDKEIKKLFNIDEDGSIKEEEIDLEGLFEIMNNLSDNGLIIIDVLMSPNTYFMVFGNTQIETINYKGRVVTITVEEDIADNIFEFAFIKEE